VTRPARAPGASRRRADVREATVRAQAKINLYLRVLAREDGGYHQLETLMQRLALGDRVRVRVGPGVAGRTLDCRGPALPPGGLGPVERNLAYRAAVAFAEATGWPDAFAIAVEKEVPVGGGLGGGSADAGAVLRCLNALAPEALAPGELLALAAPLGADVPFLTAEAPLALAWGRGERMLALPPLPVRRVHLACFAEGVPTGPAYAALAEWRRASGARARPTLWTAGRLTRWDDVALVATNDFEHVVLPDREDVAGVRQLFADVARQVERLNDPDAPPGADGAPDQPPPAGDRVPIALMSGSGATVFLLTPLAGVEVGLEVAAPADAEGTPAVRVVETRTARRVARVQVRG
jgi:4-diphosphocytidyl-2-C-methyl-D-erythritol kinase